MRVYLLWIVDDDDIYPQDSDVLAVFATRELAEQYAGKYPLNGMYKRYFIQEREVKS